MKHYWYHTVFITHIKAKDILVKYWCPATTPVVNISDVSLVVFSWPYRFRSWLNWSKKTGPLNNPFIAQF